MKANETSFYEWQKKFSTHGKCMAHLAQQRWPQGSNSRLNHKTHEIKWAIHFCIKMTVDLSQNSVGI